MNDSYQITLKNSLTELLEKLNNGEKFSLEIIETNYKEVQEYIKLLYPAENSPFDDSDENIYCFIKNKQKIFNKYHIQDIVNTIIDYKNKENTTPEITTSIEIIKNYIENKNHNDKSIYTIISEYASSKKCNDSKNIKKIIENTTKEKELIEKIFKYETHVNHCKNIANIILDYENEYNFYMEIESIIKESSLPQRNNEAYQVIASYAPYELTHCISYEMAIRNKDVIALLKNIKSLTILSKKQFEDFISFGNIEIEENPYLDSEMIVKEALELLDYYKVTQNFNIKFKNYKLLNMYASIMQIITQLIMILEKNYFMIYDNKEIVPEEMEDVFKESNHFEPDRELNQYMNKAIEELMKNEYDPNHRYKDNYTLKDGYAVYQASYDDSKEYDINKIKPNFKRPMREFNQTEVSFNMSLPKDEIIAYIEKIKNDYDNKEGTYKTLNQLLYGDDTRIEDKLAYKQTRYADDFFIYDYYTSSEESHEKKLEIIQKKLSQFHGMKIEISRNNYEPIDYEKAQIEEVPISNQKQTSSISLENLKDSFKNNKHIIHYLAIEIIEERYNKIKKSIDGKKYKTLIHHG